MINLWEGNFMEFELQKCTTTFTQKYQWSSPLQELIKLWKHNVLQSLKAQNRICWATWNLYQKIHHRNIFKETKYMWMNKNILFQFTKIAQKFNYSLYIYECKRPESYCTHSLLLFILFYWILNIKRTYV